METLVALSEAKTDDKLFSECFALLDTLDTIAAAGLHTVDESPALENLKRDVAKLKRVSKKRTITEIIREQRNKFSRSRRPHKTWDEIYQEYRVLYPKDVTANSATLRLSLRRDPTDNRQ